MAFLVSPQVLVVEKDLTNIIPAVSTSIAAFAGRFTWGPVNQVVLLNSENDLVSRFGKPNTDTFKDFFSAANFLAYGDALRMVRVIKEDTTDPDPVSNSDLPSNSVSSGTEIIIRNENEYEQKFDNALITPEWVAKYPGSYGNNLGVSVADETSFQGWEYRNFFDDAPDTTNDDEVHIVVYDATGTITGFAGTVLETFAFTTLTDGKFYLDGATAYYKRVIEETSKYVWVGDLLDAADISGAETVSFTPNGTADTVTYSTISFDSTSKIFVTIDDELVDSDDAVYAYTVGVDQIVFDTPPPAGPAVDVQVVVVYDIGFTLGRDGVAPDDGDVIAGYELFSDAESLDVNLIFAGPNNSRTVANELINICEDRKDCMAFLSPEFVDVVQNFGDEMDDSIEYRTGVGSTAGLPSTSYAALDSGWKYQYDKFNDVFRWVPLNPDIAGLAARTDLVADPWFSPAGFNRGQIKNVVKLAWNPNKAQRDELYKKGINPVITTKGDGTILFGDKTLLSRPSAFDRINVRRLFIVLEKAIATAAKFFLFELNDEFTRAQFRNMVEPFLRDVQGRRGIQEFLVVCDETNNTGEVIDRNEFVADIYIKPARSINYIILNFVAVRTSVNFNEIIGA